MKKLSQAEILEVETQGVKLHPTTLTRKTPRGSKLERLQETPTPGPRKRVHRKPPSLTQRSPVPQSLVLLVPNPVAANRAQSPPNPRMNLSSQTPGREQDQMRHLLGLGPPRTRMAEYLLFHPLDKLWEEYQR